MTREVAGYGKTYPVDTPKPAAPEPGIGEQLLDNTVNDVAGIAQGAAALPDMAAEGDVVEDIAPTPDTTGGRSIGSSDKWLAAR
jgi:hypothetical protein